MVWNPGAGGAANGQRQVTEKDAPPPPPTPPYHSPEVGRDLVARAAPPAPQQGQAFQIGFPALALRPELWLFPYPNSLLPVSTSKCGLTAILQTRSAPSSRKSLPRPLGPRIPSCPQEPRPGASTEAEHCVTAPPPHRLEVPRAFGGGGERLGGWERATCEGCSPERPVFPGLPHTPEQPSSARGPSLSGKECPMAALSPLVALGEHQPSGPPRRARSRWHSTGS